MIKSMWWGEVWAWDCSTIECWVETEWPGPGAPWAATETARDSLMDHTRQSSSKRVIFSFYKMTLLIMLKGKPSKKRKKFDINRTPYRETYFICINLTLTNTPEEWGYHPGRECWSQCSPDCHPNTAYHIEVDDGDVSVILNPLPRACFAADDELIVECRLEHVEQGIQRSSFYLIVKTTIETLMICDLWEMVTEGHWVELE